VKGKKEGRFVTRTTAEGAEVRVPVGIITGTEPGPQITIYGGHHGTEYAGIEAVQRLYRTLNAEEVAGRIVIALVTNELAFWNWEQFAPALDEVVDLKRELAQGSQYLIDCHGGEFSEGMCPYVICRQVGDEDLDTKAMAMAEAFGLPYISVSQYRGDRPADSSGGPVAWWLRPKKSLADELRIPEITPEVGQAGSRDNDSLMYDGVVNVLRQVGILPGPPARRAERPKIIGNRHWIEATEQGIFFPEVDVCQDVVEGQRLGLLRDYFGNVLEEVISPANAKVMNMNSGMPVKKGRKHLWLAEFEPGT
jgi:predicted deacylase